MEKNLSIYCITDLESPFLESLNYNLVGVGKNQFTEKYINCANGENIQNKEEYYSELTFHYWFWKNRLNNCDDNSWIGFCQKRRFWLKDKNKNQINNFDQLKNNLLKKIPEDWSRHDSVICKPIFLGKPKLMKLIKRGWKNLIYDPSSIIKGNIKLHFDMHHGYGTLEKAATLLKNEDRLDFLNYINSNNYLNPHIMFISKKKILEKWFSDSFEWLFKCEKIFGFDNLVGYDKKRLYAFLAERYASFWFKKYAKPIMWEWTFFDITKNNS